MSTPPTPPEEKTTLTIGQLLGHSNQFRIVRLLGRGGFGEVYLAREDRAQRHLAIKVMLVFLRSSNSAYTTPPI